MDTNKIMSASVLDLLFEDRNKDYGAYELRKFYPKRILKSLLITASVALLAFAGSVLGRSLKTSYAEKTKPPGVVLTEITEEKKPEPIVEEKKPEVQVKTIQYMVPIITNEVVNDPLPDNEDIKNAIIDVKNVDGVDDPGLPDPKPFDEKGVVETKPTEPGDEIYPVVEIPAKFSGNWEGFLRRNLNAEVPVNNNAPAGRYTVIIQFVVDKEGNVSDIKSLTNVGYGMEEEALRVIKKAPKWEPGVQSGYKVKSYHRQPITFEVVTDE